MDKLNPLLTYFGWAFIQHSIVISSVWFLPIDEFYKTLIGIFLFSGAHYPNGFLMLVTFILASVFYSLYFIIFDHNFIVLMLLLFVHVFEAMFFKHIGVEMRVLFKHPKWPKFTFFYNGN